MENRRTHRESELGCSNKKKKNTNKCELFQFTFFVAFIHRIHIYPVNLKSLFHRIIIYEVNRRFSASSFRLISGMPEYY